MKIVGINFTTTNGIKKYTLHITDAFEPYYMNAESGRGCVGEKVESIYVGEQDCSQLKIGDEIENDYEKDEDIDFGEQDTDDYEIDH